MDCIFLLILLFFLFIVAGAIVAFVALGQTGSLRRTIESYADMIADLSSQLATLTKQLTMLQTKPPPQADTPPEPKTKPEESPAPPIASLAPKPDPSPSGPLADTIVQHETPEEKPEIVFPSAPIAPIPPLPPVTPAEPATPIEPPPADFQRNAPEPIEAPPERSISDWTNFESAAGKRWLTWAGATILFLSAAFFLKHAFDVGWIGPGVQVSLAILAGITMLGIGEYFLHTDMPPLGYGLIGGGIMILYAALFAAYSPNFYKSPVIESQTLTFALMCVVTITGMTLAIRHNAIPIAFLAILGGMLTPVLVSTGTDARDPLFSYLLLLDLGVLAVAFYKKWRALDILAFGGTVLLFLGWYYKFGINAPIAPPLAWLAAFWSVFAIIPVAHHIRHKTPLTVERIALSLMNATYGFVLASHILSDRSDDLAWVALIMSGAYLTMGVLIKLRTKDAKATLATLSLSMMFLMIFPPLHFGLNGITMAWLAEAVVLVYLGFLFEYKPARIGGFIAMLLATMRVVTIHIPLATVHDGSLAAFANTNFWTMMCVPLAGVLAAGVNQAYRRLADEFDKQSQTVFIVGAGLLTLLFLSIELDVLFRGQDISWAYREYMRNCCLITLWSLGAIAFLAGVKTSRSVVLRVAGGLPLGLAILLVAYTYTIEPDRLHILLLNPRMAASLIACGALWAYSLAPSHPEVKRAEFVISSYASVGLLCAEILPWVWRMSEQWKVDPDYTTLWAATLLLSACAAVYLAVAAGRKKSTVYLAGVLPLFAAWICALQAYWRHQNIELMMFGNPRFITSILTLMLIFAWAVYMRSDQDELPEVKEGVTPMYTWFTVSLLALLSVEPAGWLYRNTIDPQQAAWTAQMAVTIVWGLYATAMLSIGFWRRIMPLRLAALALFGITAIKLLAVDMAHIDKIFRIISFFVMGILMIGASYLYHKAEKRLKQYDEFSDNE